jgi:hypothetical protein
MKHVKLFEEFVNERTFDEGEIALYDGGDDGMVHIFKRGKGYYGYNDEFDFEAKDKKELEKKLNSWGYELLAGSIDEAVQIDDSRADLKDEEEGLMKIRHFQGSVKDLDDWLRNKIGETNPYKDTIMVNGPHQGEKDNSLPYQDFQNGQSDLIKNRYGR